MVKTENNRVFLYIKNVELSCIGFIASSSIRIYCCNNNIMFGD